MKAPDHSEYRGNILWRFRDLQRFYADDLLRNDYAPHIGIIFKDYVAVCGEYIQNHGPIYVSGDLQDEMHPLAAYWLDSSRNSFFSKTSI